MPPTTFTTLDELRGATGRHLGWTDWVELTQQRVGQFREATGDGADVALLVLAMSNLFLPELLLVPAASAGVNYGTGRIRFPGPAAVGGRVRGGAEITAVDEIAGGLQTTITITIAVEDQTEPACVVESLSRWLA